MIKTAFLLGLLVALSGCDTGTSGNDRQSILLLLLAGLQPEYTYYVDSASGDDANSGLSDTDAWKTLDRVNGAAGPGSTVLFKRGGVWRGQLRPVSGTLIRQTLYGAYGTGGKPLILGSADLGSPAAWTDLGGDAWRAAETFDTDIGNMIYNGAANFGKKRWSAVECAEQGDYYYDRATGELTVYSVANPGSFYSGIEAALRRHIVDQQGARRVTYEDLALKYGGAHGFGGGNTGSVTIRRCDISYVGGGDLRMDGSNIRFGNGIEFWDSARGNLVEKNRIWEIYDSGLSNQNQGSRAVQADIIYRNNIVWNCGMSSFEYWNRPAISSTSTIVFEHNTCAYAGAGWGAPPQRPDPVGVHILLPHNDAMTRELAIRNNIFFEGNLVTYIEYSSQYEKPLFLDYNCYYRTTGELIFLDDLDLTFDAATFADYRALSGKDAHSITGNPLLADPAAADFTLQAGSPCIDAAGPGGAVDDFNANPRPSGITADMGAYEFL